MSGELNTEVHDEPESCRRAADWVGGLQPGVSGVGDAVHRQRSASESFWQGTAGDSCRRSLSEHGDDADELEEQLGKVKSALLVFAAAIDGVRRSMADARADATAARLIVTPTAILPPEPASPNLPGGPHGDRAIEQGRQEFERKHKAFEEAKGAVEAARTQQDNAHRDLEKSMEDPLERIKTTKTWTMFAVGHGLGTLKGSYETAKQFEAQSERWTKAAATVQANAEVKPGNLRTIGMNAAEEGRNLADDAARRGAAAGKFGGGYLSKRAGKAISANPARWIHGGGAVAKTGSKFLRGVPFVGTAASVVSGAGDVALGKDPVDAAQDTTANIAGGAAGGWAGAAVGTAICPGVGTVIGGVVGGIAGSMAATEGVSAARGD
ncbi:hypothetical protein [Saccharopolyspora sp. SCSIO 74807]|uniref:hypothetical protein n=1 Tax=Saccharopolyspora sp. SCSIO 74807 TaxID=3118084 RepID=UPI0030D3159F